MGVSLSEFVDSLIVGQLLNERAFAIINLANHIVILTSTFYTITGQGGSLLSAEYLAKKKVNKVTAGHPKTGVSGFEP